jgi:methyl-accepting chemotaxis protein
MSKTVKPARQKGSRIGIAARIYAALGMLTMLTLVASAVAWFSYDRVSATVNDMVEQKMPMVELALELSQAATASTALAPRFMQVQTVQQRSALTGELDKIESRQFDIIRKIGQYGSIEAKRARELVDGLSRPINDINDLTGERLRNTSVMQLSLESLDKARENFVKAVGSEADEAQFNVAMGIETVKGLDGAAMDAALKTLNERDFPAFDLARKLEAQVNELIGLLREIVQIDEKARLGTARERLNAVVLRIQKDMAAADKIVSNRERNKAIEAVIDVGQGSGGVVEARGRDLLTAEAIANSIKEADTAAGTLRKEVEKLVNDSRAEAISSNHSTAALIEQSKLWLGAIGGGSLLIALALSLLYVRPAIVGRLNRLWSATRAIADGELETVVQTKGNDEISDISKSVLLFRDNAVALRAAEAAKVEDDQRAQEQRRQMMAELGEAFGVVVSAAAAGDFSRRVEANFADEELNALAASVNSLLETVQTGLTETCDVLGELSAGHLSLPASRASIRALSRS